MRLVGDTDYLDNLGSCVIRSCLTVAKVLLMDLC